MFQMDLLERLQYLPQLNELRVITKAQRIHCTHSHLCGKRLRGKKITDYREFVSLSTMIH